MLTQKFSLGWNTHTCAPVNHLSPGTSSRKPQRESCWQEAAALHLSVKVSKNTMWLSSALSSVFTSPPSLSPPLQLFFSSTFLLSIPFHSFSIFLLLHMQKNHRIQDLFRHLPKHPCTFTYASIHFSLNAKKYSKNFVEYQSSNWICF